MEPMTAIVGFDAMVRGSAGWAGLELSLADFGTSGSWVVVGGQNRKGAEGIVPVVREELLLAVVGCSFQILVSRCFVDAGFAAM